MNDIEDRDDDDQQPFSNETSHIENLMIQALVNQLTSIVNSQNRSKQISYDNAFKQAETLRSLAQTALMLTDGESLHLHGMKIQNFLNKSVLEHLHQLEADEPESKPGI